MSERVYLLNEEEIEALVASTVKDLLEKTFNDIATEGSINLDTTGRVLHAVELRLAEETGLSFEGSSVTSVLEAQDVTDEPLSVDDEDDIDDEDFGDKNFEVDKRTISQELKGLR